MIAAIDPGSTGGFAWIDKAGEVKTCAMANRREFIAALWNEKGTVYIEKVTGYYPKPKVIPGEGEEFNLQGQTWKMFNFGKSAGICHGICEAFDIEPKEVMPAQWQKVLFLKKSGTRSQWKNKLKEIAQKRYPQVKVTLANADALLILSYACLITNGSIETSPTKKAA